MSKPDRPIWVGTYDIVDDDYKWRKLPFFTAIAILALEDCLLRPVDPDAPDTQPLIRDIND